mgnify:CR=1 FL=1
MANAFYSGSITIDSDGAVATKAVKVAYIVYTPAASGDSLLLYDHASSGSNLKLTLKGATANNSMFFDFSNKPLSFANGIYADITASGTATLILTSEGAST